MKSKLKSKLLRLLSRWSPKEKPLPKILSVSPLSADPSMVKLVLDDNTVAHVRRDGPVYEVGQEYVAPPVEETGVDENLTEEE